MAAWYELTHEQLNDLPTHRLYEVFKLWRYRADHIDYYEDYEYKSPEAIEAIVMTEFIKAELNTRGHIERKDENSKKSTKAPEDRDYKPSKVMVGSIKISEEAIGLQVVKTSKRPFKSKNVYNTVKGVTKNPHTNREAFTFEEDDSIVDVHICNIRKRG